MSAKPRAPAEWPDLALESILSMSFRILAARVSSSLSVYCLWAGIFKISIYNGKMLVNAGVAQLIEQLYRKQ